MRRLRDIEAKLVKEKTLLVASPSKVDPQADIRKDRLGSRARPRDDKEWEDLPNVTLSPLSAEQENDIWSSAFRISSMVAQPMTGWLLHSARIWTERRALSDKMLKVFGVSSKTWDAGLPKRPRKMRHTLNSLDSFIRTNLSELTAECGSRKARALERSALALAEHPTSPPCTLFHHTFGIAGGDRLEALAVAFDHLTEAALHGHLSRKELSAGIVKVATSMNVMASQTIGPRHDLDPGLDALLLLMAQMDHDLVSPLMPHEGEIKSLITLLVDGPGQPKRRRVQHRLLDIYYALAMAATGRPLPEKLPSIREMENVLLGGPPESGGQSWVVRWRNGTKALRERDVSSMIVYVEKATGKDLSWTMRRLYAAAQIWARVEEQGSRATGKASERYAQWWEVLCDPGRSKTAWLQPYWAQF